MKLTYTSVFSYLRLAVAGTFVVAAVALGLSSVSESAWFGLHGFGPNYCPCRCAHLHHSELHPLAGRCWRRCLENHQRPCWQRELEKRVRWHFHDRSNRRLDLRCRT